MSTELKTKMTDHTINEFWGGNERGKCVQVTKGGFAEIGEHIEEQLQKEGYIQLTMEDAAALCNELGPFIKREAVRRQGLLKSQIEAHKEIEKTVFNEVAALPENIMAAPGMVVNLVSKFCPKV